MWRTVYYPVEYALIALIALKYVRCAGSHWTYDGANGPDNWKNLDFAPQENHCGRMRQSPIDIVEYDAVIKSDLQSLEFINYDKALDAPFVTNNGHTVMVTPEKEEHQTLIRFGPLKNDYRFLQMHFHWGGSDKAGSEHLVNGRQYPMEAHLVHLNTKYNNSGVASHQTDGLSVVGVFFEIQDNDNPHLGSIINSVKELIADKKENVRHNTTVTPVNFLPTNLKKYYTYSGSLTTPPCTETVTWIVLSEPIGVSETQIQAFRKVLNEEHHPIANNFRPAQPLNSRVLEISFTPENKVGSTTAFMWLVALAAMWTTSQQGTIALS